MSNDVRKIFNFPVIRFPRLSRSCSSWQLAKYIWQDWQTQITVYSGLLLYDRYWSEDQF